MPSPLLEQLRELASRLEAGELSAVRDALGVDYFEYAPAEGEPGAAERIGDLLDDFSHAMSDLSIRLTDLRAQGDLVAGTVALSGTHDGRLWGAPPTGGRVSWVNPATFRALRDGIAVRFDDTKPPALIQVLRGFGVVNPADEMHLPPKHPVSPPDFLLKVILTGQAADKPCSHLGDINVTDPATDVCERCVASDDIWPALRMCLTCGAVGCCDTSVNKHAAEHARTEGHPLMRSIRLEESWMWCYEDNAFFEGTKLDKYRKGR